MLVQVGCKDGAAFAADLCEKLRKQDLSVWRDLVALEGGRDWWSQIEEAIRSKALQHFVLAGWSPQRRGRKGGRKPVVTAEKLERARTIIAKGLTVREAAVRLKVGKTALYDALRG